MIGWDLIAGKGWTVDTQDESITEIEKFGRPRSQNF